MHTCFSLFRAVISLMKGCCTSGDYKNECPCYSQWGRFIYFLYINVLTTSNQTWVNFFFNYNYNYKYSSTNKSITIAITETEKEKIINPIITTFSQLQLQLIVIYIVIIIFYFNSLCLSEYLSLRHKISF